MADDELAAENIGDLRWCRLADIVAHRGPDLFSPRDLVTPLTALVSGGVPDWPVPLGDSGAQRAYDWPVASIRQYQVTFDCAEPERLARFWCEVLGYVVSPPPGFATWADFQRSLPPEQQDA